MPTVRSPSSFAARKMRMAISLRLAASSFWIFFGFVITGAKQSSRETSHFHTSGPRCRRSFFNAAGKQNLSRAEGLSENRWHCVGAHRTRRHGLQSLQLYFDLAPFLRLALGG